MSQLPEPWGAYSHLQADLSKSPNINNRAWALEAALDALVAHAASPLPARANPPVVTTVIASAERRERHRRRLRRIYAGDLDLGYASGEAADASLTLKRIRLQLPSAEWNLVVSVAEGEEYASLASVFGATPAALRVRTLRIRRSIASLAA